MPENVPLYNDMRVTEYLDYRAALKGVPHRRIAERVGDVKELCGLKDVEKKLIGDAFQGLPATGRPGRRAPARARSVSSSTNRPSASIQIRFGRCAN